MSKQIQHVQAQVSSALRCDLIIAHPATGAEVRLSHANSQQNDWETQLSRDESTFITAITISQVKSLLISELEGSGSRV